MVFGSGGLVNYQSMFSWAMKSKTASSSVHPKVDREDNSCRPSKRRCDSVEALSKQASTIDRTHVQDGQHIVVSDRDRHDDEGTKTSPTRSASSDTHSNTHDLLLHAVYKLTESVNGTSPLRESHV
jgi:hypothetical protein